MTEEQEMRERGPVTGASDDKMKLNNENTQAVLNLSMRGASLMQHLIRSLQDACKLYRWGQLRTYTQ